MLKQLPPEHWDYSTAAHLLNRAGFGGNPREIEKLLDTGLEKAVAQLVDYEQLEDPTPNPEWAKPDPERLEKLQKARQADEPTRRGIQMEEQRLQRQRLLELKFWWLQRMAQGPRPLQEKMTLFWHGHFATSMQKVRDAYLMWKQNEVFRQGATGNWQELLLAVGKDPAMLVWLDQAQSRKDHPNENFAREVMELFALGEGHYTEKDVTEAARAFTGWSLDRVTQQFIQRPGMHDSNLKTVLGRTGNLNGTDVIRLIASHPQSARFITAKLWRFFAGTEPSEPLIHKLAEAFTKGAHQFKPVLKVMFQSEEFYASDVIRNQVKSPVQWLVGTVKVLERPLPPPFVCFGLTRNLGQDLFAPPNVKGWDGGLSWITTNNLLARYNEAAMLVKGDLSLLKGLGLGPGAPNNPQMQQRLQDAKLRPVRLEKLLTAEERADKDKLLAALERRLLQARFSPKQEKTLREFLDSQEQLNGAVILDTIRLMMSTPDYQLT